MEIEGTRTSAVPKALKAKGFTKDTLEGDFHGYRREIWFNPARAAVLGDGGNDGVQMFFALTNGERAITFGVFTAWYHPLVLAEQKENGIEKFRPNAEGGLIDYHERVGDHGGDCTLIDGGCESTNDYTNGEAVFAALCEEGPDAVWEALYELLESDNQEEE